MKPTETGSQMKKTLYEILGVSPGATEAEIRSVYPLLRQWLESGESGLDHAEASFRLNLIKEAYWTLSDNMRRSAYDASLAMPLPEVPELKVRVSNKSRLVPTRLLVSVIGGLFALGILIQIAFSAMNHNRALNDSHGVSLAEKKVALEEYKMTTGASSPDEIAATRIREEEERLKSEKRRREYASMEEERRQARELEDNRRYAARVSQELQSAEERARQEAEYAAMRTEEEERAKREKEKYRQEEQRRMWQRQLNR
ncbi:MAG: DnaJ domain-containing protein [Sulfuricella denitrificans]|nr:DnaJ domain-containing protein [Sulfuricella denitrificans]